MPSRSQLRDLNDYLKVAGSRVPSPEKKVLNKVIGELNNKAGPLQTSKTRYGTESNYTLQGGKDYRETILNASRSAIDKLGTNSNPSALAAEEVLKIVNNGQ